MRGWMKVIAAGLTIGLLFFPQRCVAGAKAGLMLCANGILPVLFPFFVLSRLLLALDFPRTAGGVLAPVMKPLFGVSGRCGAAVVLGAVCGYPIGAETAKNLYLSGECTKEEAETLTGFCNNAGPLFVMGTVGLGFLANRELGVWLYGIHLMSSFLTGIGMRWIIPKPPLPPALPPKRQQKTTAFPLGAAVEQSVTATFQVCGFVVLFSVAGAMLPQNGGGAVAYGFLEITGGIGAMVQSGVFGVWLLPMISMVLALSGLSVFFQVRSILEPAGLSVKPYLWGKLLQGAIALVLTRFALPWMPQAVPTGLFSTLSAPEVFPLGGVLIGAGMLLLILPRGRGGRPSPERRCRQALPWGYPRRNPNKIPPRERLRIPDGIGEPFPPRDSSCQDRDRYLCPPLRQSDAGYPADGRRDGGGTPEMQK